MRSKEIKLIPFSLLALGLILIVSSCGKSKKAVQEEAVSKEVIKSEVEKYAYPLPSTFELTNMLNKIEASYIIGITNDPLKADSYLSEGRRALNLGVYSADLAYATTYNNQANVQAYFKASETLIRELDFAKAFSSSLPDEIEANMENKDEMTKIVTNMFQDAYGYLNKQGRSEVSYLILAGTLVEGLYLTTNISANTFENPDIVKTIMMQKEPLARLETMMSAYKDSELSKESLANIKSINNIYGLEEGASSFSKDQIAKLTTTINTIRETIVK